MGVSVPYASLLCSEWLSVFAQAYTSNIEDLCNTCSVLNLAFALFPEAITCLKGLLGRDELEGIVIQLKNYAESFLMYRGGKLDYELFPGIWFVVSLFVIRLLFSVKYVLKHSFLIAIICVLYMGLSSFIDTSAVVDYHIYKVLSAIPFFVVGLLMGKNEVKFGKLLTAPFEMKIFLLVIFVIICSIQGFCSMGGCRYGYNYIFYFINALIGTYLLICTCRLLPERKYVILLSTGTFLILGLHRTLSTFNVMILFNPIGIDPEEYALLNTLLIIVWLYWPIKFLLKHKPILLGK